MHFSVDFPIRNPFSKPLPGVLPDCIAPGGGDPSHLDANYPPQTNCWPEVPGGGGGGGHWGGV